MARATQWMTKPWAVLLAVVMLSIAIRARAEDAPAAAPAQPSTAPDYGPLALPAAATSDATTAPAIEPTSAPVSTPAAATAPTTEASGPTTGPAAEVATTEPTTAPAELINPALAERLASIATVLLRSQNLDAPIWNYAEALMQAACRIAPTEPRFASYLVEVATRAGDRDTAMKALSTYCNLRPDDEFAQIKLINAYLSEMDLSAKIKYLEGIVNSHISNNVRSYAAQQAAQCHAERLEGLLAADLLDKAIELNPLNLDALRVKYGAHPPEDVGDRLRMVLQMLRANPAQPSLGLAVAKELANAGLTAKALDWYNLALDMHQRMGFAPPPEVGVDYAAELFISGAPRDAAVVVDRLIDQTPNDLNAWMLRLLILRNQGDKEGLAKAVKGSTIVALNDLAMLRQMGGDTTATTRPVDSPDPVALPDPQAELQKLVKFQKPELIAGFVPVAINIAWTKLYFGEDLASAGQASSWIKTLATIGKEGDEVLDRLTGWALLVAGNKEQARAKFAPLADIDPMAAVGMVRAADKNPAAQQQADALARKTLARNPSGLTGALLVDAFASRGIKVSIGPDAMAVDRVMSDFPKDLMMVVSKPELFYKLRVDPVRSGVPVGEPLLVQVTVSNISDFDLTMGPEGVIHQDLWLDAQLQGMARQVFPAEAYERLPGPLVLKPGTSTWQVIRLDQHGLYGLLDSNPVVAAQVSAMVMTNATTVGGNISMGPAGQRSLMTKLMERSAMPLNGSEPARQRLASLIQQGTPSEKIRCVETLAKFLRAWAQQQAQIPQLQQMVAWGADLVHTGQIDPDPTVSAWSQYLETVMTSDKKSLAQMIDDPLWLKRLLSILATDTMGAPRDDIKKLTQDPDPTVAKLAKAALEAKLSSRGATTEPSATQPSTTQPGIGPIPAPTTSPAAPVLPAPVPAAPLAPIVPEAPAPAKPQPATPPPATPTPPPATPAATPAPVTPPPAQPAPAPAEPVAPKVTAPAPSPAPATPPAPTAPPAAAPTPAPAPTPPPTVPPPSPSGTDNIVIPPPPPEK